MKLKNLQIGDGFILSNKLDPELSRFGQVINIGVGSIRVKWERHFVNDENGELVNVKPYSTNIARETEVLKKP